MTYNECLKDISAAKNAISESLLDITVPSSKLICEVYCLTSFDQTFYLQVYDGEQYTLLFAKPFFRSPQGLSSCAVLFSTIVEAEKHPAYRGDIYCGMKYLPKSDDTITTLIKCLPAVTEVLPDSRITIDGNTALIISHLTKDPVTLFFNNEEPFQENSYSPDEEHFLHELYLHIQSAIGNLVESQRHR